jgi:hypothetical protein
LKFKSSEKRVFGFVAVVAYLSGVILFYLSRRVRVYTAVGEQHHSWEHSVRWVHSGITYIVVLSMGYLLKGHILPALRSKKKGRFATGIFFLGTFFTLVGTALVTLYAGESEGAGTVTQIHAVLGLAAPVVLFLHVAKWKEFLVLSANEWKSLIRTRRGRRRLIQNP